MIHTIVPYDRDVHAPYVRESWAKAARLDRRELDWWLRRPETTCVVATVPNSPELILGWAAGVVDENFLIWIQVKKLWWRRGLAVAMAAHIASTAAVMTIDRAPTTPIRYAYPSRLAERIGRAHPGALRFDPTLARRVPRESSWLVERKDSVAHT